MEKITEIKNLLAEYPSYSIKIQTEENITIYIKKEPKEPKEEIRTIGFQCK